MISIVLKNTINLYIGIYFLMLIVFMVFNSAAMPDSPIIMMQVLIVISFYGFYIVFKEKDIKTILWGSIFFQLILSILLRIFFNEYYNNPFGANPIDSALYHQTTVNTINLDFSTFLSRLSFVDEFDISDYGYPVIQRWIYKLSGGPDLGISVD